MTPAPARSVNNEVPHTVQNPRTSTAEEFNRPIGPVIVMPAKGISTRALNAAPIDRWHTRQWQTRTLIGSPRASYRETSQKQPPLIDFTLLSSRSFERVFAGR
jgi:hypothetical protein